MALDATVGGDNANSYIDIEYADFYFSERLHSQLWTDSTSKTSALITATRMLDQYMDWAGYKYNLTSPLEWPRGDVLDKNNYFYPSTVLPSQLKNATCELAYSILSEDRSADNDMAGIASLSLGSMRIVSDKTDRKNALPEIVIVMLRGMGVPFKQVAYVEGLNGA